MIIQTCVKSQYYSPDLIGLYHSEPCMHTIILLLLEYMHPLLKVDLVYTATSTAAVRYTNYD